VCSENGKEGGQKKDIPLSDWEEDQSWLSNDLDVGGLSGGREKGVLGGWVGLERCLAGEVNL